MQEMGVQSLGWESIPWVQYPGEGNGLPTPVFWPGEFPELYSPWGRKELNTTEQLSLCFTFSRCGSRLTPKEFSSSFVLNTLGFRLSYCQSPPFGHGMCKVMPHQSMKGNANGHPLRLIDNYKLYNSRLLFMSSYN